MSRAQRRSGDYEGRLQVAWWLMPLLLVVALATAAAPASAGVGYELDGSTPSRSLGGEGPHGIAVDQASRRIYVALTVMDTNGTAGEIERFESSLSGPTVFSHEGGFYTGVAVDPTTQGFYAAQALVHAPMGTLGRARMEVFSSAGSLLSSFALSDTETLPQIAADSSGLVYYPNAANHTVQVFDSAGTLQKEVACSGCPGGTSFGRPVSVALDSAGNLYVVDLNPDRVVKLTPSGGGFVFGSTLQSGLGAAAVGIDPATDTVLVGDLPNGVAYHIVAYDSTGTQIDDFGGGMFVDPEPQFGALVAGQIAVDSTSHRAYVADAGKFYVFDRVASSSPPSVSPMPATAIGQLGATLHAGVNPHTHTVLGCEFELTDDADFQANGFANARAAPCQKQPFGNTSTPAEASVGGLLPATLYHYRETTTTFPGAATGGEQSFETLPAVPPAVTTEAATAISEGGATLRGAVNPRGGSVSSCRFEYGTSTAYGSSASCASTPGAVTTPIAVSRAVMGLAAGTAYHYRLAVTSNAGTSYGQDVSFATGSPPPPAEAPTPQSAPAPAPEESSPIVSAPTAPPLRCRRGFRKRRIRGRARCVKSCRRGLTPRRVHRRWRCVRVCRKLRKPRARKRCLRQKRRANHRRAHRRHRRRSHRRHRR